MPAAVDLTGQRFGKLVALEPTEKRHKGEVNTSAMASIAWTRRGATSQVTRARAPSSFG